MPCTIQAWYQWVDEMPSFVLLDGGLGYVLSERGNDLDMGSSLWSGRLLVTCPEEIRDVARSWLDAGSDIITTATYQVSTDLLSSEFNLSSSESEVVFQSSVRLLNDARTAFWSNLPHSARILRRYPKIGVSMGPYSAILCNTNEYSGLYEGISQEELVQFHRGRCNVLQKFALEAQEPTFDLICFETIGNTNECIAIVDIMMGQGLEAVPYWISFQCRDSERIACGETLSTAIELVLGHCLTRNLVAIGINCVSVHLVQRLSCVAKETVRKHMSCLRDGGWRVDTLAYPNTAEVWSEQGWTLPEGVSPHRNSQWADVVRSTGATLIGGCCRVDQNGIQALHAARGGES